MPAQDAETVVVVVEPEGVANARATITIEHLADDSVAAVRYVLLFEDHGNDAIGWPPAAGRSAVSRAAATQDFATGLCV